MRSSLTRSMGRHIVSYHYPCPDGIFAALAARQHFKETGRTDVRFFPNKVFAPVMVEEMSLQGNDTLYMCDYIGPAGFVEQACNQAGRVVLLDHHKTAIEQFDRSETFPGNLEKDLDINLSGCTIALRYFRPQVNERQRQLFQYIEDADLWRWKLEDSKFFHAGFGALGLELDCNKNTSIFDQLLNLDPDEVIAQGKLVQAEIDRKVQSAVASAGVLCLGGESGQYKGLGKCLFVQAGSDAGLSSIRSQLGNALAEASGRKGLRAIGLIAYREAEMASDAVKCSLRSVGSEDTTVISKAYGGGGHLNASSFIIPQNEFETWCELV